MAQCITNVRVLSLAIVAGLWGTGCGQSTQPAPGDSGITQVSLGDAIAMESIEETQSDTPSFSTESPFEMSNVASRPAKELSEAERFEQMIQALKPFHHVLGKWRGTTQKEYSGFKAVEFQEWVWDFRTDPSRPAIALKAKDGPYFQSGRLTYDVDRRVFQFNAVDAKGAGRVFEESVSNDEWWKSDDNDPFAFAPLQLTEVSPATLRDTWRISLTGTGGTGFVMELARQNVDGSFAWMDTVVTERAAGAKTAQNSSVEGNSCVVSQGPAGIEVQYQGHSYWVCCSGCREAFDEEPERWLAKMASRDDHAASIAR